MITRPEPKTAAEALEIWRKGVQYLGDDPMMTPEDLYADANRVLQLAEIEQKPLEELVSDETERQQLVDDAKTFDDIFDNEGLFERPIYPDEDPGPAPGFFVLCKLEFIGALREYPQKWPTV